MNGSFGQSIVQRRPVSLVIIERLWPTLALVAYATALAVVITMRLTFGEPLAQARRDDNSQDSRWPAGAGSAGFRLSDPLRRKRSDEGDCRLVDIVGC